MSLSAVFLAALGVGITLLPQELLIHAGAESEGTDVLLIQMLGAAFLGLTVLNWMSKGALIGGIYGRPVTMANFFHFGIGAVDHHFAIDVTVMAATSPHGSQMSSHEARQCARSVRG